MTISTQYQMILPGLSSYGIRRRRVPKPRQTVGRFIHLGAGVQSSVVVEMMVEGEIPPVDAVLFADVGNEPPWVYGQVWYLAGRLDRLNIPLVVVHLADSAGMVQDIYNANGTRFASLPVFTLDPKTNKVGQLRRQCTSEYKIGPLKNYVLGWLIDRGHAKLNKANQRRVDRAVQVESLFGISMDEFDRAKMNNPQWYKSRFPLLDRKMDRRDCSDAARRR